jgi:hypothetical protein
VTRPPKLTDRERHQAAVAARRTPADRARALAESLAEVAAMRFDGRLAPYPTEGQFRRQATEFRTWTDLAAPERNGTRS